MTKYKYNTIQEAWNDIYVGMAEQGWKQARGDGGFCVYLTPTGLRCAVGHLLKESKDVDALDGEVSSIKYFLDSEGLVDLENRDLLEFLQEVQDTHDGVDPATNFPSKVGVDDMRKGFDRISHKYNLVNPAVE